MENDVAVRLKTWADQMGYVHRGGSADFHKLCKHKTKPLWNEAVSRVKPLSQLDHIRKNILLLRMRNGTHLQPDFELSGSIGREVKLRHELKQLLEQKKALLDKISTEEASIRDIQRDMKKKCAQNCSKQSQLKEAHLKAEILRIKKRDCESFKSWLDDVHTTAKSLCPKKAEFPMQPEKDLASSALEKCIKVVQDYQTWCQESVKAENIVSEGDHHSEQERRKLALWKAVTSIIGKIPPEQVWNSLLCNFMEKSVSEMASLASSVDMKAELDTFRDASVNGAKPNQDLSAMYLKSLADTADHLVKAEVSRRKLDQVLEQKANEAEENIHTDMNVTKSSLSSRDVILDRLRLHSRQVQLEAVKTALTDAVAEMKMKTQDLSSCAQRLKEERATVTRFDNEIAEMKLAVEQGLLAISDIENKLRKAQQGVIDELDNFAEKCTIANDVVSSNSCDETISTTQRTAVMSSSVLPTEGNFVCSTPAPKSLNCGDFIPLDETGLTNASIESIPSKRSFREIVSTMRNAVSNESKSFFKLPLDLVPKVKLSTCTEDISGLLLESPAIIARLSCTGEGLKQLMHLSPYPMATDSVLVMLHVFHDLGHVRASQLLQLTSGCSTPNTLCAAMSQQYLMMAAPEQDTNIRDQLRNVATVIENAEEGLMEGRETFNDWVRRPVQGMLPSSLQVDCKSLKEWQNLYDSLVNRLR